ncbi:gem-associated protein 8 [Halyomorpha halys]|uniref:gem-associated protein 8 n=1 Tax=Halyomorpha halys TaxID=286706 RepID=UPI0006D4C6FC|nr:gem-associated protein 8-like [Halyomorpha halys]
MKISSEQKCNKKKNKNRKRSKKRRGNRRKFKYQKSHTKRNDLTPVQLATMNGESYWKNYNNVIHWQRNYLNYINSCHLSPETSFIFNAKALSTPLSGTQTTSSLTSNVVDFSNESNSEYHDSLYDEDVEEEEEEEFEVTEEMMDFLEQSMKHKEAMRLKAEAEMVSNESKEVEEAPEKDVGRDDIEECQTPKEKTIDEKRISEMSNLYGKSSPMILGMETALQLTFNKNCDVYKPAFWPCLPLKIQFNNK